MMNAALPKASKIRTRKHHRESKTTTFKGALKMFAGKKDLRNLCLQYLKLCGTIKQYRWQLIKLTMSLTIEELKRRHTKDGQKVPKLSNHVTASNTRKSCIRDINTTLYSIYLTLKMTYVQAVIDMTVTVTNNNPL